MGRPSLFDETYFDSGKRTPGRYSTYGAERLYPAYSELARDLVRIQNPHNSLDVGCAKGILVQAFRVCGVEAFGVDVSDYAIGKANVEAKGFLSRVDVGTERLPFEDRSFDLVTAMGVLDYVPDFSHALGEVIRVLRKNGLLFVTVACRTSNDAYRARALEQKEWIRMFESGGLVYAEDLTEKYSWDIMRLLLTSVGSTRGQVASKLASVPALGELLKSYLGKQHCVLFFRLP